MAKQFPRTNHKLDTQVVAIDDSNLATRNHLRGRHALGLVVEGDVRYAAWGGGALEETPQISPVDVAGKRERYREKEDEE